MISIRQEHDLKHALYPAESECKCGMSDITNCVICERRLHQDRDHTDVCGKVCFRQLLELQRHE